jgi:integration host factor subunit beta
MTKSDLITRLLALNPHLRHEHAERIVDTVFEEITKALAAGGRVELRGFGSFITKKYKGRTARNPRTGEPVEVADKRRPSFKPSLAMHERLNGVASGGDNAKA